MAIYKNRSFIRNKHPEIAEALDTISSMMDQIMLHTNTTTDGGIEPPPQISSLNVAAQDGIFDVSIADDVSPVTRGINYFIEYAADRNFSNPTVVDLGTSRNWRRMLGNQTLYFRAYSSYPTSSRSQPLHFQDAVIGGGRLYGPPLSKSSGSGTTLGSSSSDGGFGNQQRRSGRLRAAPGPANPKTNSVVLEGGSAPVSGSGGGPLSGGGGFAPSGGH
jgi:hypothetical protein